MSSEAAQINKYWTDIYYFLHYSHEEKITHQSIRILQHVEKQDEVGINEIAAFIKVSPNTASEHVKRLIQKGYLEKLRHPMDDRKAILHLTESGKAVLQRNTGLDEDKLIRILNQLGEDEKYLLEEALKLLSERAKQCM